MERGPTSDAVGGDGLTRTDIPPDLKSDTYRLIASPWHTLLVVLVEGLLSYRGKLFMERVHAAGDLNRIAVYERTIVFEWAMLGLVLIGVWWHGGPLLSVLGARWSSWRILLRDLGLGLLFLMVTILMGAMLSHGAHDSAARLILPQGKIERWVWIGLSLTAGICEEALYRGYLQRQCIALTRSVAAGIILSAIGFGAAHSYQGLWPAVQIGVLGALAGVLAYWCKSVRPGMIAHVLQDILGGFIRQ